MSDIIEKCKPIIVLVRLTSFPKYNNLFSNVHNNSGRLTLKNV